MTRRISAHQVEALDRYFGLVQSHPDLFSARSRRPIVLQRETLEAFAEANDVVLGVSAETPYLWLINDLVESRNGAGDVLRHPYLRIIAPPDGGAEPGVVVLATVQSDSGEAIVLVEQERHATGTVELELPRGFGESAMSAESQALEELRAETGYVADRAEYLGTTLTNSGTSDGLVSFFHVPVTGRGVQAPEMQEAISGIVLLGKDELWARIYAGSIRDGFTVQALGLYEHRVAKGR
jgi:ADP-ribose pyrophosphatase